MVSLSCKGLTSLPCNPYGRRTGGSAGDRNSSAVLIKRRMPPDPLPVVAPSAVADCSGDICACRGPRGVCVTTMDRQPNQEHSGAAFQSLALTPHSWRTGLTSSVPYAIDFMVEREGLEPHGSIWSIKYGAVATGGRLVCCRPSAVGKPPAARRMNKRSQVSYSLFGP
jgi:hypothetical protein